MSASHHSKGGASSPCAACRFLRRKCVKGTCVFAPYFHSDQGTAHFAAVHKVFGASNASKMLLLVPPNRRLDAVVAMCYEAVARVRDPVHGCVGHIFTLQQQVVNLQAELAYIQARLSTLQCCPLPSPPLQTPNSTSNFQRSCDLAPTSTVRTHIDPSPSSEMVNFCSLSDGQLNDDEDLQAAAHEFLLKYLPGVLRPSSS